MPGLIGKKIGMTRIFSEEGFQVPVTVIEAGPCPVVQVRSENQDGYHAIQLGFGSKKAKQASQAEIGHSATAGLEAARVCAEQGHKVKLFEAAEALGGQLRLAERSDWKRDLME